MEELPKAKYKTKEAPSSLITLSEQVRKHNPKEEPSFHPKLFFLLCIYVAIEVVRLIIDEILLSKTSLDWAKLVNVCSVILLITIIPARRYLHRLCARKAGYTRLDRTLKILYIVVHCCLLSVFVIGSVHKLIDSSENTVDDFSFLSSGLTIAVTLIVPDLIFTGWYEKCIIASWFVLNIGYLVLEYRPVEFASLIIKAVAYLVYIIGGYWLKEKFNSGGGFQKASLSEWNEIQNEILQHLPENIAVFDLEGKVLYQNQYFKNFQSKVSDNEDGKLLASVHDIKRRTFVGIKSLQTPPNEEEIKSKLNSKEDLTLPLKKDESKLEEEFFNNLSEVIRYVKKAYHRKLMAPKNVIVLDGRYPDPITNRTLSMEIKASLFEDSKGNVNKIILILKDTTERDMLAALESTNKFKDNMLASISHELRTPLNGFKSLIETSLLDPDIPTESKKSYMLPAFRSAEILSNIVNDIFDYLLLTRKGLKMHFKNVVIHNLFENCFELMKNYTDHKNINYTIQIADEVPKYFRTDPNRLRQVVLNLLSNAFKFTIEGSVQLIIEKEGPHIRVTVTDNGQGMDEQTQKKLTNILADNLKGEKINEQSSGIGFGLCVSHMVASLLGPTNESGLYFESELNQGSTFTFLIEDKENEARAVWRTVSRISSKNGLQISKEFSHRRLQISESTVFFKNEKPSESSMHLQNTPKNRNNDQLGFDSDSNSDPSVTYNKDHYLANFIPSKGSRRESASLKKLFIRGPTIKKVVKCECPKVLVVDDEPMNILALTMICKQFRIKLDTALSGEAGLDIFKKRINNACSSTCQKHGLIFMDLNMPGWSGFETTAQIRKYEKEINEEQTAIVACTAYLEEDYKRLCINNGMQDFINKPITHSKLAEIFEKYHIEGDTSPSSAISSPSNTIQRRHSEGKHLFHKKH